MSNASSPLLVQIDALLALADAATPGPWRLLTGGCIKGPENIPTPRGMASVQVAVATAAQNMATGERDANAAFIASARTDWPASLRALRVAVGALEFYHTEWHPEQVSEDDVEVNPTDTLFDDCGAKADIALATITAELSRDVREGRAG